MGREAGTGCLWGACAPDRYAARRLSLRAPRQFRVVKVNKRGKAQQRILELNFTEGIISVRAMSVFGGAVLSAMLVPGCVCERERSRICACKPPRACYAES